MKHLLVSVALIATTLFAGFRLAPLARAEYPKPSVYPKTWEFKFEHSAPKRVVVQIPGNPIPQAYWYMTYTVTNLSNQEQMWLPDFEMLLKDGRVLRSDISIPEKVFDTIKAREKKQFLEPYPQIQGILRIGEDQAKDGVAIWPEPMTEMGSFSIFVGGLSGEAVILKDSKGEPVKDAEGKPAIVRKTLRLNFIVRGDDVYPGQDKVNENPQEWVMR
jgi:hypothetical protein